MAELKEIASDGYDDIVKETYDAFHRTGTAIDEASEETTAQAGKAGKSAGASYIEGLQSELNKLSTRLTSYGLEQKVWTTLFGGTATDADKTAVDEAREVKELNHRTQQRGKAEEA